jgi:methylated-DNA-[protein]-cysteine S-methyltransferase
MKRYLKIESPIGLLGLVADQESLTNILWPSDINDFVAKHSPEEVKKDQFLEEVQKQLDQYFLKRRKVFDIPLSLQGTEFQKNTWQALQTIPYGETKSYQEIAMCLNNPNGVRAVGGANSKNPIAIIIPCHRVIEKNGQLGGYTGGIATKKFLLDLEQNNNVV